MITISFSNVHSLLRYGHPFNPNCLSSISLLKVLTSNLLYPFLSLTPLLKIFFTKFYSPCGIYRKLGTIIILTGEDGQQYRYTMQQGHTCIPTAQLSPSSKTMQTRLQTLCKLTLQEPQLILPGIWHNHSSRWLSHINQRHYGHRSYTRYDGSHGTWNQDSSSSGSSTTPTTTLQVFCDASITPDQPQQHARTTGLGVFLLNLQVEPTQALHITAKLLDCTSVLMAEAASLTLAAVVAEKLNMTGVQFLSDSEQFLHLSSYCLNKAQPSDPPDWRVKPFTQLFYNIATTRDSQVYKPTTTECYCPQSCSGGFTELSNSSGYKFIMLQREPCTVFSYRP